VPAWHDSGLVLIAREGGDNLLCGPLLQFAHKADGLPSGLGLNQQMKVLGHQNPTQQEKLGFLTKLAKRLYECPAETLTREEPAAAVSARGDELQLARREMTSVNGHTRISVGEVENMNRRAGLALRQPAGVRVWKRVRGKQCSGEGLHLICALLLGFGPFCLVALATQQEDAAADVVAAAFVNVRQSANLSRLERMGKNPFREKVCRHDMRFGSGLIRTVAYETSDLAQLPGSAQRLATSPDSGKTAARFGIGVCFLKNNSLGKPTYSVLIATYESRSTSFWRIFWD
jgi:hypothetical protein